jgi:7-cyano-7-deazaguanine reductase
VTEVRSTDEFVALGHTGSEHYAGLETFENPGVTRVEMTSDELTAVCPITGQPDMYVVTIEYGAQQLCLESKSLKAPFARRWPFVSATTSLRRSGSSATT